MGGSRIGRGDSTRMDVEGAPRRVNWRAITNYLGTRQPVTPRPRSKVQSIPIIPKGGISLPPRILRKEGDAIICL